MRMTNKHNLPAPLVKAMTTDHYSKGDAKYSATGMMNSPRIAILQKKYHDRMQPDVTSKMFSFLGTQIHHVLRTNTGVNEIGEERLFAEVDGVKITGEIDLQQMTPAGVAIWDYKLTSVWSVMSEKKEWEQQLNIYKWLVETVKGQRVVSLNICAMLRDWASHPNRKDWPEVPVVVKEIPVWDSFKAETFIRERIAAHERALDAVSFGEEPPLCTDDERWMTAPVYAVRRVGRKTAIKLYEEKSEAEEHAAREEGGFVERRKGEPRRCMGDYCGVSQWCEQYKKELENGCD